MSRRFNSRGGGRRGGGGGAAAPANELTLFNGDPVTTFDGITFTVFP